MKFKEIDAQSFDAYAQACPNGNFWQSTNMADLRARNGWSTRYVAVLDDEIIQAACMLSYRTVFLGSTFVQAVRGFLIDYTDLSLLEFFHNQLIDYLQSLHCMYFKIDPYLPRLQRDINGDEVPEGFNNEYVVAFLKKLGYRHDGFLRGNDESKEPNWMFVLNLKDKSEAELLKAFDQQTRWSINKTLKMNIQISEITSDQLPEYKRIMEHTAIRRGFQDHDLHYYEGLFQCFKDRGHMMALSAKLDVIAYEKALQQERQTAEKELTEVEAMLLEVANSKKYNKKKRVLIEDIALLDKKIKEASQLKKEHGSLITLAAATFMLYGKEVIYLYSGAYDDFMKFNGPYALQWYMIRYALQHGYETYNFYGISGIFDKSAQDYGIYEFKKGFTGTVVELIGDFYYELQPMKYHIYKQLRSWKHKIRK